MNLETYFYTNHENQRLTFGCPYYLSNKILEWNVILKEFFLFIVCNKILYNSVSSFTTNKINEFFQSGWKKKINQKENSKYSYSLETSYIIKISWS